MSDAVPDTEKLATAEEWAEMDFQPWVHSDDEWTPPSNTEWNDLSKAWLPSLRIAWLTMYKTKPELEYIATKLDSEPFFDMLDGITAVRKRFDVINSILSSAEARLLSAASSAMKKHDPEGFAEA